MTMPEHRPVPTLRPMDTGRLVGPEAGRPVALPGVDTSSLGSSPQPTRHTEPAAPVVVPRLSEQPVTASAVEPTKPNDTTPTDTKGPIIPSQHAAVDPVGPTKRIPTEKATERTVTVPAGDTNIRRETLPDGTPVLLNKTHPQPELVELALEKARAGSLMPDRLTRIAPSYSDPTRFYGIDAPLDTEAKLFVKYPKIPEDYPGDQGVPDTMTGEQELQIAPKIRESLATAQAIVQAYGYEGVDVVEPIGVVKDRSGRDMLVFPYDQGRTVPHAGDSEAPLGTELHKLYAITHELAAHFIENGIATPDLDPANMRLTYNPDTKKDRINLVDYEDWYEIDKLPPLEEGEIEIVVREAGRGSSRPVVLYTRGPEAAEPTGDRRYAPGELRAALLAIADHLPADFDPLSMLRPNAINLRDAATLLLDPSKSNKEISQITGIPDMTVSRMNRQFLNNLLKRYPDLEQYLPQPTGREFDSHNPAAIGQRFDALRRLTDLTQRDIADRLDWSYSKVVRFIGGYNYLSTTDLRAALDEIGITDPKLREELIQLNRTQNPDSRRKRQ